MLDVCEEYVSRSSQSAVDAGIVERYILNRSYDSYPRIGLKARCMHMHVVFVQKVYGRFGQKNPL
jgi:hypothetical protein